MSAPRRSERVITPASWSQQRASLKRNEDQLLDVVGWFGSAHALAMWRKAPEFLAIFHQMEICGFDPQVDDWDPSYVTTEAEVMANASVIIIRLENKDIKNGSLGSIAETGLALTSAALRGQIIVISIEDNLVNLLDDPGAIAMYMVLELALESIADIDEIKPFLRVHRGNDLRALAAIACLAAQEQMTTGQINFNFKGFLAKKIERRKNSPLHVLMGGSGGPYVETYKSIFYKKRQVLSQSFNGDSYSLNDMSTGPFSRAWSIPYGSKDNTSIALSMRTLLSIELEAMQEADLLLLPIVSESASIASVTKIGFLLLYTLSSGQDVQIILEPFSPVDYIYRQLQRVDIRYTQQERAVRTALLKVGVPADTLAVAERSEVAESFMLVKQMGAPKQPSYKDIKNSLLGKTQIFYKADNIRRVRILVQAHLEKLQSDPRFLDFFGYSTKVEKL